MRIISLLLVGTFLLANSLIQDEEKSLVQSVIPKTKIEKIKHSYMDGLYEVYLKNGNIIYVYPYKRLIFFGEIYTNTGINLTSQNRQKWQDIVNKQKLKNLSAKELLQDSFKIDFGSGSKRYTFILFTDPECPFCRKVDKYIEDKNVTFYINYMPLYFHKNAKKWALQILSSKNKKEAIKKIEKTNKDLNVTITNKAKEQLQNTQNLAKKLNIKGTPTIFVIDTKKNKIVDFINGANMTEIEKWLKRDKNEK